MVKKSKEEVNFIATKHRNEPVQVSFYTKEGKFVAFDAVEKRATKTGVKFYATVST